MNAKIKNLSELVVVFNPAGSAIGHFAPSLFCSIGMGDKVTGLHWGAPTVRLTDEECKRVFRAEQAEREQKPSID